MRAAIAERARTYRTRYEQFGLVYTALAPMRSLASMTARRLGETSQSIEAHLLKIEGEQGILGPAHRAYSGHSPEENRAIWTAWDWSRPGGGRWSEILQPRAELLILVDVTQRALELCKERLADATNVGYVLSHGGAFPEVDASSIDWVWSFDVFVHIAPLDVASYIAEIARVLRPGGTAVIHHSGELQRSPGWRSPMTAVLFAELARERGLEVTRQFDSWSDGRFGVRTNNDVITMLRLPGA